MRNKKHWFFLMLGLVLFFFIIWQVGLESILTEIVKLKWKFLYLVVVYALVFGLDTLGWKFAFKRGTNKIGYWGLFITRVAGEAVNSTTPTGYMGGEPVKALILKRYGISMPESLASLVVAKTTLTLSQVIFVFMGLIIAVVKFQIPAGIRDLLMIVVGVIAVIAVLFTFFQQRGLFSGIAKSFVRFKVARKFFLERMEKIRELEAHLIHFYQKSKSRFLLSLLFHLLGWLAGILEIYLILIFLKVPFTFWDAFVIEALHQMIRGLAFIVPGNLGTQEGGSLFIFTMLGFSAVLGLTTSLIRRIREIIWSAIGWIVLISWHKKGIDVDEVMRIKIDESKL